MVYAGVQEILIFATSSFATDHDLYHAIDSDRPEIIILMCGPIMPLSIAA